MAVSYEEQFSTEALASKQYLTVEQRQEIQNSLDLVDLCSMTR